MVGEVNVASGASSDETIGITDPGIRLLTKIGDFVEPLTRFDRGHLALESSDHRTVDVLARQTFRIAFDITHTQGIGALPEGVTEVVDARALQQESAAQLASAKAMAPKRLTAWAASHGETPEKSPAVSDCFIKPASAGRIEVCSACGGGGEIDCTTCKGAGTLTCEACTGRGSTPCTACDAKGETTCPACKGMRTVITHRERKVRDEATGKQTVEHVQETATCGTCSGNGIVTCARCGGRTEVTCATCHGQKTVPCKECQGAGSETCSTCNGAGRRYYIDELTCSIREAFETTIRSTDPETSEVLKSLGSIENLLQYAGEYRATAEIAADTLRRDTIISIPVTSVTVEVGGKRAQVRGFGPKQDVLDYHNVAGMLLSDDLDVLESTLLTTKLVPPTANEALYASLAEMLASEANVTIAESAGKKDASGVERQFLGVVTGDYVRRAGAAMKTGLGRAYWAGLAKGPVAVLATPLLYAPVALLVRAQGQTAETMTLIGVVLMTFFAALAAHYWVVHQLQGRIAPSETPKLGRIVDRLGFTLQWLAFAGVAAVALTLLMAWLTQAVFPPALPSPP